jgi:flavin-dependent dehydrogenase
MAVVDVPVDVIVVGGGPAGSAAGIALASRGVEVAVLNSSRRSPVRIGETVPPTIARSLSRLGVFDSFIADAHIPGPGTIVCWGDDEPYETDSIASPYGHGWHLDRTRFDTMLLDAASRAGAAVHELAGFAQVDHGHRGWSVVVPEHRALRAPVLLDATGRAARIATKRGAARRREDRLIGLVAFGSGPTDDHRTVIEACEYGWWYATALPRGRAVTALMTDADLLPTGKVEREWFWAQSLSETVLARGVIALPDGPPSLHAAPASSSALLESAGTDWIAVGDAARTVDPLSGQGVTQACQSGLHAAEALEDLGRKREELSADNALAHCRDIVTGLGYYRRENRWPRSPFWRRRHERWYALR